MSMSSAAAARPAWSGTPPRPQQGFSLVEALVVVLIIGTVGTLSFGALQREHHRNNALSAANDIAGWLEANRRNSERGTACQITFTPPSSGSLASTATQLATSALYPSTATSALADQCRTSKPLRLESTSPNLRFRVAVDPVSELVFTPRGTIFNPAAGATNGAFSADIHISINAANSGSTFTPMYCVRIRPPMGEIDVIADGSATSGRCST